MAIAASDIIVIMREVGIKEEIIKGLKYDVPLFSQGIDSIDLPAIAVASEKKYNVSLSDADASVLRTLNDFVSFLNGKLK
ncbi:MAG: phosphopantetheine-binding protein [Syntrophobacteraceae bacterium]